LTLVRHNFDWLAKGGEHPCVCGQFCCSAFQLSPLRFWLDVAEVEAAAFRHHHRRELALEGAQVEALVEEHRELHQLRRQVAERVAQSFSHHRLRLLIEP
jgi:hypothetical protein